MRPRKSEGKSRPLPNSNPERRVAADRNAARAFVRLPVRITLASAPQAEHVGFVRDISPRGMFFYSDFIVPAGEPLVLVLEYLKGAQTVRLELSGKALRVENSGSKEAVGIAVAFDSVHDEVPRTPLPIPRKRQS